MLVVLQDTRTLLEMTAGAGAHAVASAVETAVEAINKVLYCYSLDEGLLATIDRRVNERYQQFTEVGDLGSLHREALEVVREAEAAAARWVQRYT